MLDLHLSALEVLERWKERGIKISRSTLANWRSNRKGRRPGPPFVHYGARVYYPLKALEDWEAAQIRTSWRGPIPPMTE
jgi:hypothetical protein